MEGVGGLGGDADFVFAAVAETGGFVGDFGEEVEAFFFGAGWVWGGVGGWATSCAVNGCCCAVCHGVR